MRLRTNELCPIHRSLTCCGRESLPRPKLVRLGVQRIEDPHHPRGYRELRSRPRCESCLTVRSANRRAYAQFATKSSQTLTTSSPTIEIRRGWAERGETIIRTISKPHIGGVTKRGDHSEWISESKHVARAFNCRIKAYC